MPQSFNIEIKIGYKSKRIKVEYIPVNDRVEHFKLYGNNVIILESNRPLFRNKGIKKRKPDYKLISGHVEYQSKLELFFEKIDQYFEHNVPVKFESHGTIFHGMLTQVSGAGKEGGMYHLEVNNYYWGKLFRTDIGWQWSSNTNPELGKNIDYFIKMLNPLK